MKRFTTLFLLPVLLAGAVFLLPTPARADVEDRLYDFTDAYYFQNGLDSSRIVNRRNGTPPGSIFDAPIFPYQRNVRVLATNPAYSDSGKVTFWSVMGDLFVEGFTNDAAGRRARQIA